nr:hypothetical protein [uncultured Anaerosporobacter sp.]
MVNLVWRNALESYSVKAINYVLKPIREEKLFFTFDEVLEQIKTEKEEDAAKPFPLSAITF